MRNRVAATVASLLVASLGTAAFAQMPRQTMPQQQQTPQQMPPQQPPPATTSASGMEQSSHGGSNMSDSRVEHKIKRALTRHGVTATGIDVTFNDGTATLSGTVSSEKDVAKAKKAAMSVRGVKHVDTSGLHAGANGQGQMPSSAQS